MSKKKDEIMRKIYLLNKQIERLEEKRDKLVNEFYGGVSE